MIGRAPKAGRPRWVALASAVSADKAVLANIQKTLSADKVLRLSSDDRFKMALTLAKKPAAPLQRELELTAPSGEVFGRVVFSRADVKLSVDKGRTQAFSSFLEAELPLLIKKFIAQEGRE